MSKLEYRLERIIKGVANHRRIEILRLLEREPDLALETLCQRLRINMKTGSEHARRLALAGLIAKRKHARQILHAATPRGRQILAFLKTLE